MKQLSSILAAAVVAGLASFLVFQLVGAFGVMGSEVVCEITVFVLFIALSTIVAAALGIFIAGRIADADRDLVGELEARIRMLEEQRSRGAS